VLKTHESTRKLARPLEQGTARILAAAITRTADRWFVSFTVEVQRTIPSGNDHDTVVGVDLGVRHLASISTGATIPNPRALEHSMRKLGRLNRPLARRKLARVHAGMVSNRHLARVIADTGLAELRRQLSYKTTWYGSRLVVADRFYPSSKTCSACGWVKAKLTLAERTFTCEACGLRVDRDLNAARNLAKLAEHVAQGGWETQNARGADMRPGLAGQSAAKREASSPSSHETGTVLSQDKSARNAPFHSVLGSSSPTSSVLLPGLAYS
jgi:putative transposase